VTEYEYEPESEEPQETWTVVIEGRLKFLVLDL
jgi:hypothetical protein